MIAPDTVIEGRYRVLRSLGEGGMGTVYEAEHLKLCKRVAIKVLNARLALSDEAVLRFEREARAMAAIEHANIVAAMDFGMWKAQPFVVMELLDGETLAERLDKVTTIQSEQACLILGQVLSALASTHAVGIIHRDLKPENIFLVGRAESDMVRVLDFGVSKFPQGWSGGLLASRDGEAWGTPGYMAPEQCMGCRDIDHRADLYAAGVML